MNKNNLCKESMFTVTAEQNRTEHAAARFTLVFTHWYIIIVRA